MTTTPEKADLVTLTIDGITVRVPKGTLLIRAAERAGIQIPRFCDHPLLEPVGACRQCLVEVAMPGPDGSLKQMQGPPGRMKPQASCTMTATEGMEVRTQVSSPGAAKAQAGVMELLLINHPLDCPVCDKGGECPLQNQAMTNGRSESRFAASGGVKRTFAKPIALSAQVLLDRERCVLCARCTRFAQEVAGDPFIALVERGAQQQVGTNPDHPFNSYFSGNTIQICPVGALTSAEYRFRSRPFDLVSTPGVAEHDACGSAIRVDHRRGTVMRRMAGDDPEVNQEWITDKDRFGFGWTRRAGRLTHPLIRDAKGGELRAASWTEAFAVAARGLAAAAEPRSEENGRTTGGVGLLPGGRLAIEDAYAWAKFARVALGTHDIDHRARPHSAEETAFLTAAVASQPTPTYADLAVADTVLLVGLETEEDAGVLFLRLRQAARRGLRVLALAPWTTPGLAKLSGQRLDTVPGAEAEVLAGLDAELGERSVVLLGERLATSPGALTAARELAARTGARWAWVPRRAGERGGIEAGTLPTLLPGGRPVADPSARVDLAAAWGVTALPSTPGRDATGIVADAAAGILRGLVVGGVDPDDTPDPAAFAAALAAAEFLVSFEVRPTAVTDAADVVFPVAAVTEKAGTFITWDGRARSFEAAIESPNTLPELRTLAGIAAELDRPLGFRTTAEVRAEMATLGPWDGPPAEGESSSGEVRAEGESSSVEVRAEGESSSGEVRAEGESSSGEVRAQRAAKPTPAAEADPRPLGTPFTLATWRLMLDDSSLLAGAETLRATARTPVARINEAAWQALGRPAEVEVTGSRGSTRFPVEVTDIVDGVIWLPTRSSGRGLWAELCAPGEREVRVSGVQA